MRTDALDVRTWQARSRPGESMWRLSAPHGCEPIHTSRTKASPVLANNAGRRYTRAWNRNDNLDRQSAPRRPPLLTTGRRMLTVILRSRAKRGVSKDGGPGWAVALRGSLREHLRVTGLNQCSAQSNYTAT